MQNQASNVMVNSTLTSTLYKYNPSLFSFPFHPGAKLKTKTQTSISFARNSPFFVKPIYSIGFQKVRGSVQHSCADGDEANKNRSRIIYNNSRRCNVEKIKLPAAWPIIYALFYVVFGFVCPFFGIRKPALAAVVTASPSSASQSVLSEENEEKGDKYPAHTRRLLGVVSKLLNTIQEAKDGKIEDTMVNSVKEGLNEVKTTKRALHEEIIEGLISELKVLNAEKEELIDRCEEIVNKELNLKWEEESLMTKAKDGSVAGGDRVEKLREGRRSLEREYNDALDRIGKIENLIVREETVALSIRVRELIFIEGECEAVVESFLKEIKGRENRSTSGQPDTKLSKEELQKELQNAHRLLQEQIILPDVLASQGTESLTGQDTTANTFHIEQALRNSRKMQKELEDQIRKTMRKHGEERRYIAVTPPDEVVKGYPDIELKWTFGKKEVAVPRAVSLHLLHGWKKWREDVKMDLKQSLLEDSELCKKYIADRQERILRDRDRVMSRTWYNEQRNRWELDPIVVPYAVSRKLVEGARIRHDWAAMYVMLKGDDKEYYVDICEFEMLFEDFGGFDALYMRMLGANIPTAVQLMWIPFSELDFRQQFLLPLEFCRQCFTLLWNSPKVLAPRKWAFEKIRKINDDIMVMIVFPLVEFVIPYEVRLRLGMAWPEYSHVSIGSSWYLKWQSEAETSFRARKKDGLKWYIWFLVRTAIYGYVMYHVFQFMRRKVTKVSRVLGFGTSRRDPNLRMLRGVKAYYKLKKMARKKGQEVDVDPVSTAFDRMKRIKDPPIQLKDFLSIEPLREEINEVVAFLQNPHAFQDMGARAPRGVLIVGEEGTGKRSLAMAIAAEAKVPLVEVKAHQLENDRMAGQSASNVRELFQIARDLAPVIIFVEEFDLFAGVRGKFIHTKKQDHESFINQLLVELDGFEKQDGVVLIATTEHLNQIDEALRRPGRMDRIFSLQKLIPAERERILRIAAKETMDEDLIDFVDWQKVAEKTAFLLPVELKKVPLSLEGNAFRSKFVDTDELMSYCSWFATFSGVVPKWVRETKPAKKISKMLVDHLGLTLTKEDLQNVVELMEPFGKIRNGIEMLNPPLNWTRETKFPHAVWAAGRGLMAYLLPNFDVVEYLWLESSCWEGVAFSKITKARNEGSYNVETRAYLEKKLVFSFGSYVASCLLLPIGEESILPSLELKDAREIAIRMVMQYGWGPDDSPTIYHHGNAATTLSMGDNFEYEMAARVEMIYNLAYDKAKALLQKNYVILEKIAEELVEYEVLSGKDLERIVSENGGIREKEPFIRAFMDLLIERHKAVKPDAKAWTSEKDA
ncbi:ATP-dependent zinc metalloprotease FtsH [Striga asiatica]|uniref:ATP-dependent zinc metalloprotease FtsH n=1 Tax=Striga asiatica TaxID=4170 RepID=A0A5A7RBJ8_STRAF|nr:ATP-dependent zinc metalloprotease FtsH [Striga asiatica]